MSSMEGYTVDKSFNVSGELKKKDLWRIFSSSLIPEKERGKVKFQRDSKKGKKGVVVFIGEITMDSSPDSFFISGEFNHKRIIKTIDSKVEIFYKRFTGFYNTKTQKGVLFWKFFKLP